jgi:CRISPR-associated protein Cas6
MALIESETQSSTILQSQGKVDIIFPIKGMSIPVQHGYRLFSALSRLFPYIHDAPTGTFGVFPIRGRYSNGTITLTDESCIRIRVPKRYMPDMLTLAGKQLIIKSPDDTGDGWRIRVGRSKLLPIRPSKSLRADMVLIRLFLEPGEAVSAEKFMIVVQRQMQEIGISGRAEIPLNNNPKSRYLGELYRKIFEIKEYNLVGYALELHDLNDADSIVAQERGLGGKRSMGCGLFDPYRALF